MNKSKKYEPYFEKNKPIHSLSYCAFLDVLGFSERIRTSDKLKTHNELLGKFHSLLGKAINRLHKDSENTSMFFKSFTDNVVIGQHCFSDDCESEFGFILWSLREYQFNMACEGFFIRGGLSIGQLFIDENSVYGTALLDAYDLESKHAVNPIVVLSEDVKNLVNKHLNFYQGEIAPQYADLLTTMDGKYFVNYLTESLIDGEDGYRLNVDSLQKHKFQIEKALADYSSQPAVFSKFSWLATYHNYFCKSVSTIEGYSADLEIPENLSKVKFRKISNK